jgi:gluconolactonase
MGSRWNAFGLCLLLGSAAPGCGKGHAIASGAEPRGGADASGRSSARAGRGGSSGADADPQTAAPVSDGGTAGSDATQYPELDFATIGAPEVVADTFSLAESPNWDHCTNSLLFVDVDRAVIHQLTDGQVGLFMENSGCANGLAFDGNGDLLMAQMGCGLGGSVSRRDRAGNVTVLADRGAMGAALHTPDDLAVRSDGTIYFTDGDFPHATYPLNITSLFTQLPIYRIAPDGTVFNEAKTTGPNGIELAPDEKTLYVSSYFGNQLLKFAVADDGSLQAAGSLVTGALSADSLCLDVQGNVYLGVSTGLLVVRPDGTKLGTIPMQTSKGGPTSCGFGGPDGKTLYVTAWTTLYKIENMPIPGLGWSIYEKFPCP